MLTDLTRREELFAAQMLLLLHVCRAAKSYIRQKTSAILCTAFEALTTFYESQSRATGRAPAACSGDKSLATNQELAMLSRRMRLPLSFCLGGLLGALFAACGGGGGGGGSASGMGAPVVQPPVVQQPPPPAVLTLALAPFANNLSSPTFLTAPPGDARQFIVERAGRILVMQGGALLSQPFLDIRALTDVTGEGGLLSMAFDPGYASNGRFYVYRTNASHDIVVERYTVSSDPNRADPAPSLTIIQIPHPTYTNHFGGLVAFGPDGYLYLGTGDGGSGGDPNGNAQNPASLLGKLLRLDVGSASAAVPYLIPATNPYRNLAGSRPEIWAIGLRNPWRFAFDADKLYIADVGQDQREEIDLEAAAQGGLNYGWNRMEGTACYLAQSCDRSGLALPVLDYSHADAGSPCSITGGYVYRGAAIPELAGRYVYSDYCAGFLRSFLALDRTVTEQREWNVAKVGQAASFGQDGQGELYVLGATAIWKIVRGQ
jgi:glucose/arabinose dehydrogenase